MEITKPNSIWNRQQFSSDELRLVDANRVQFMATLEGDAITARQVFHIEADFFSMIEAVKSLMEYSYAAGWCPHEVAVIGSFKGQQLYISISIEMEHGASRKQAVPDHGVCEFNLYSTGHPQAVQDFLQAMSDKFGKKSYARLRWWYLSSQGATYQTLYLPPTGQNLCPEFYPDLGDPDKFIKEYLESDNAILLLAGAPGTGKTSLLRHMITSQKLTAHVIYEENLMEKDSVFQTFLFEDDSDIMVIEDADTILMDRERDQNKLMSRFLNVSDGLIKLPNKKLVFTTNIGDFNKVDSALTRPGRCHGVVHTRAMSFDEAKAAALKAGLPVPTEPREYTLAELFNPTIKQPKTRRIGLLGL